MAKLMFGLKKPYPKWVLQESAWVSTASKVGDENCRDCTIMTVNLVLTLA